MTHKSIVVSSSIIAALLVGAPASAQVLFNNPTSMPASFFTNYIQLVDLDGDDDLDMVAPNCSGFISTGPQPFEAYQNNGTGTFSTYTLPSIGNKAVRQVAFGDVDADGDMDMFIPDAAGGAMIFFINNGSGTFVDEASTRLPALSTRAGATEFGDVDGDGDLDLFIGDAYAGAGAVVGHVLINDGAGVFTAGPAMPTNTGGDDPIDVDFFDVDRDFDLDIMLNMHVGVSKLWVNDGAGNFTDSTASFPSMEGFHYGPNVCDADGDGDLDVFTDNSGPGLADQVFINGGNLTFTDESSTRLVGNPGGDDNGMWCVDADQNGAFDIAIVSLSDRERFLYNNGSGVFTHSPNEFPAAADDSSLWMDFGDLNGDGRLDAVTAQGEPAGPNKVYLSNNQMPVDAQPPRIIAVQPVVAAADFGPAARFALSDAIVTDTGPRLQRAYVTVTDGPEVEAAFIGGDIFRAVLPAAPEGATVTFSACATDAQGNNACSDPQTYTVGAPGTGGAGAGGEGVGGNGAGASGTGAGNGQGADGATDGDGGDDDDGCGCAVPGSSSSNERGIFLLAAAALAISRLRRRS